jgi:hypothetical protein
MRAGALFGKESREIEYCSICSDMLERIASDSLQESSKVEACVIFKRGAERVDDFTSSSIGVSLHDIVIILVKRGDLSSLEDSCRPGAGHDPKELIYTCSHPLISNFSALNQVSGFSRISSIRSRAIVHVIATSRVLLALN